MKKASILLFTILIPILSFTQVIGEEEGFTTKKPTWKELSAPVNFLGMEAYGNSGDLATRNKDRLFENNSFSWELYYAASIPRYNWISFGAGIEITGSIGHNEDGTIYDRQLNESFLFIFQAFMNISPWFTLHFNSLGRVELRGRYTFDFANPVSGNFGHFLMLEGIFGFFLTGTSYVPDGGIDEYVIRSPSLEFLYYLQFHKNVAMRWSSIFYVNNGLFYKPADITPGEYIPMEHYLRFDFLLGAGITLWTRFQLNIANSGFSSGALFLEEGFDFQIRAGIIFLIDFVPFGKKDA